MKSTTINETHPIKVLVLKREETQFTKADDIIAYIKNSVDAHPVAAYIATFDHYAHTKGLSDHEMSQGIIDAKIAIFCFGKELPNPELAAVRPRSIAVVEEEDAFTVSFMDVPNPQVHEAMEKLVKGIRTH